MPFFVSGTAFAIRKLMAKCNGKEIKIMKPIQAQQDRERAQQRQLDATQAELARQKAEIERLKRNREY